MIVLIKFEDKIKEFLNNKQAKNQINHYEELLRQEEAEIRKHISEEQQLKLNIERLQEKILHLEESNNVEVSKSEDKNELKKEINELNKVNNKLLKEKKKLKSKIKEKENEILNYITKLKWNKSNNNKNKGLIIDKQNSFNINSNNKNNLFKNIKEIEGYNDSSHFKNNSIHSVKSISKKYSKSKILYNLNSNNSKTKLNKNQNQNFNKIQKNVSSILEYLHEQNSCFSPTDYIISSFKRDKINKIRSKDSSPYTQHKFKYSTISNNNCSRNNSQVMINVNTNIINSNSSIEKLKLYKKIKYYNQFFSQKIKEISKNIIPNSIKRTLSSLYKRNNSSPSINKNNSTKQFSSKTSNRNLKKKIISSYKINKQTNKSYKGNMSISEKKTENSVKKKIQYKLIKQKKEATENLKVKKICTTAKQKSMKPQEKNNSIKSRNHKTIMKNSSSNNVGNMTSINFTKFHSKNIVKNYNKIKNLVNNGVKTSNDNYIDEKKVTNFLLNANKKASNFNNTMNNNSAIRKFNYLKSNFNKAIHN